VTTLAETQRLLWQLITAPEGVAAALAADGDRGGSVRAHLLRTVRSDQGLDAAQRLDIYANMYFFRILDVLKEDYPATRALLGDVAFHNLITDYLVRHPPAHFSIREAGRQLPELLAGHPAQTHHPCVADLARYERDLHDAFDAPDAAALRAAALAAIPQQDWPQLRFALHPSVRLLASQWPVHDLRAAVDRGETAADPDPEATWLCVWRDELVVYHRPIAEDELARLAAITRGATFGEVCALADESAPDGDAAQEIAAALARWLANGWLVNAPATR